jgi:hypothetical protein
MYEKEHGNPRATDSPKAQFCFVFLKQNKNTVKSTVTIKLLKVSRWYVMHYGSGRLTSLNDGIHTSVSTENRYLIDK